VQGFPDTRTGPATKQADDMDMKGKDQPTDRLGDAEPALKSPDATQKTAEPGAPQTLSGVDFVVTEEAKKEWIGKSVYSSDGADLGDVADLKTGPDNKLTEFYADIGGFLGLGTTRVIVGSDKIQEVKDDRIVLNLKKADAQGLPRHDEAKPSETK
jgi:sporulation protein YlmC with PRC-barrel domain